MAKTKKVLSFLVKLVVSLGTICYVVWKIQHEYENAALSPFLPTDLISTYLWEGLPWLLLALLLVPVNLGLETLKWKLLVREFYPDVGYFRSYAAVLAGMAAGILTPNRVGEYAGRALYLKKGKRVEAITATFMDRIAQMLVTMTMGVLALGVSIFGVTGALLPEFLGGAFGWIVGLLILLTILAWVLVLYPALLVKLLRPFRERAAWIRQAITALEQLSLKLMGTVLVLAFARYLVFFLQFLLLLTVFFFPGGSAVGGFESVGEVGLVCIPLVFLFKSIIPSVGLTELGVRETVAVTVFEAFGVDGLGSLLVVVATTALYVINVLVPTLVGAGFLWGIRLPQDKEGTT
jgi:uncharacterized membrane protein YbhN (UPF0104 family)